MANEFDNAAAAVVAPPEPEPAKPVEPEVISPGVETPAESQRVVVSPEFARGVVRYSFLPVVWLTKDDRWIPTGDEAEDARVPMQECLQKVFDKYLPALFAKYSPKHPEVFALAGALAMVGWRRWQFISKDNARLAAERAEVEKREAAARVTPIAPAAGPAPAGAVACRLCGLASPDGTTAGLIDHECKPGGA